LLLTACQTAKRPLTEAKIQPVRRSQPLLGTFVTITAYGEDPDRTQTAITAAFDEIRRVDLVLSIHKPESEISRVNQLAAERPVEISPELRFVLETALRIADETHGSFDPSIGPLAQLWGFIWKEYRLPTKAELDRVSPLVNYKQVRLATNATTMTVQFARSGMFLDFGGIGKGYAVDRALSVLQKHGIKNAMVKAGGDLRVIGAPPGTDGWEVQLEDPRKEGRRTTLLLRDKALSTSGNYENYFEVNGQRYSHILNPRTGLPVQGIASCTVIAPTCTESDAYATAFFVLGIGETLQQFGKRFAIRFVDADFQVHESKQFPH
jgi:FAD:protein FMN transferase